MSPNQQFRQKKNTKHGSTNASGQSSLRIVSLFLSIVMYKGWNPNMRNLPISQVEYSLRLIYYWISHYIMSNNSTETSKA